MFAFAIVRATVPRKSGPAFSNRGIRFESGFRGDSAGLLRRDAIQSRSDGPSLYTSEDTLKIRRRREDAVLGHSELKRGGRVVTTRIATAMLEMKLRRTNAVRIGEPDRISDRKGAEDG